MVGKLRAGEKGPSDPPADEARREIAGHSLDLGQLGHTVTIGTGDGPATCRPPCTHPGPPDLPRVKRLRPLITPRYTAIAGLPTTSALPRFTAPADQSPSFAAIAADSARHRLELRPAGERVLVHCFSTGAHELTVVLLPAEPGPSRVRLSVAHELSAALAAMADVSGAVAGGTIFDAVIVDRPGFRAIGAIGAPLADLLVITDLPYFAGELQIGLPWIERRALLEELVAALARPSLVTMTEVRPIERDGSATTSGGTVAPAMLGLVRDIDGAYLARPAR